METYKSTPFCAPVVPNDLTVEHPRIQAVSGTGFIIRTYDLSSDRKASKEQLVFYKEAIHRWKRLGSYQGIELPVFSPVIGSADGVNRSLFIAAERIEGRNLEATSFQDSELPQAKDSCNNLIAGLAKYSQDVFEKRGDYLNDQNLSQYVYGKTKDGCKKIFFVDFGLEYHVLPSDRGQHHENSYFFGRFMISLYAMLEDLEEKVGEPLTEGRTALADFLERVPQGSGGASYAQALQRLLLQVKLPVFNE